MRVEVRNTLGFVIAAITNPSPFEYVTPHIPLNKHEATTIDLFHAHPYVLDKLQGGAVVSHPPNDEPTVILRIASFII